MTYEDYLKVFDDERIIFHDNPIIYEGKYMTIHNFNTIEQFKEATKSYTVIYVMKKSCKYYEDVQGYAMRYYGE